MVSSRAPPKTSSRTPRSKRSGWRRGDAAHVQPHGASSSLLEGVAGRPIDVDGDGGFAGQPRQHVADDRPPVLDPVGDLLGARARKRVSTKVRSIGRTATECGRPRPAAPAEQAGDRKRQQRHEPHRRRRGRRVQRAGPGPGSRRSWRCGRRRAWPRRCRSAARCRARPCRTRGGSRSAGRPGPARRDRQQHVVIEAVAGHERRTGAPPVVDDVADALPRQKNSWSTAPGSRAGRDRPRRRHRADQLVLEAVLHRHVLAQRAGWRSRRGRDRSRRNSSGPVTASTFFSGCGSPSGPSRVIAVRRMSWSAPRPKSWKVLRSVVSRTMWWVSTTVTRPSLARRRRDVDQRPLVGMQRRGRGQAERGGEHENARTHGASWHSGSRVAAPARAVRAQETEGGARGRSATLTSCPRAAAIPDATWRAIETRDRAGRRTLRLRRHQHGDVLPAVVPVAAAAPRSGAAVPRRRRRRGGRLPRLPALSADGAPAPSATARAVAHARRLIDAHVDADRDGRLTLSALGAACGISPFHLQRAFLRAVGASPKTYAAERRAGRLRARLKEGMPVTTATYDVGYGFEPGRLRARRPASRHDARRLPPRRRRRADPRRRRADAVRPAAGRGDRARRLPGHARRRRGGAEADLAAEFPRAELAPADAGAARPRRGDPPPAGVSADGAAPPTDVGGTAFEQRVWRALRAIPFGEVRSYQQVAKAIGRPTAARAVARACAANPVALVVPCHRVVRADGTSGGYRWGAERKAALLAPRARSASGDAPRSAGPAARERRQSESGRLGQRGRASGRPAIEPLMKTLARLVFAGVLLPGPALAQTPEPEKEDPGRFGRDRHHRLPQGPRLHRHPAARGLHAPRPQRHRPQLPPERAARRDRRRQDARRRPRRDHRPRPQERPARQRARGAHRQHPRRHRRAAQRRSDAVGAGAGPGGHRR